LFQNFLHFFRKKKIPVKTFSVFNYKKVEQICFLLLKKKNKKKKRRKKSNPAFLT